MKTTAAANTPRMIFSGSGTIRTPAKAGDGTWQDRRPRTQTRWRSASRTRGDAARAPRHQGFANYSPTRARPLTKSKIVLAHCRGESAAKSGEKDHANERRGHPGKRAPISRHRFTASSDRGLPSPATLLPTGGKPRNGSILRPTNLKPISGSAIFRPITCKRKARSAARPAFRRAKCSLCERPEMLCPLRQAAAMTPSAWNGFDFLAKSSSARRNA